MAYVRNHPSDCNTSRAWSAVLGTHPALPLHLARAAWQLRDWSSQRRRPRLGDERPWGRCSQQHGTESLEDVCVVTAKRSLK